MMTEHTRNEIEGDCVVVQERPKRMAESECWEMRLGDCAELIRDSVSPTVMGDALYIGLEHIGEETLSLLAQGIATDVKSKKSRFQQGDILFGKLRPYFRKVVRAPANGLCSTDIWVVRAKDGINQDYLYYCMASQEFVDFATAGSEGTRMPRAIWEHVSRYELFLPPLPEQRAIAHVLGTLDDKIELNRRMNETLEAMARALFKSWFVDFEPVRAKMEGRWRRGESLPGLPADLYDLFPERLAPSELGEIPEGWEVKALGKELRDLVSGARPRGGAVDVGMPSIGAENVDGLGRHDYTKEKYVPLEFFDRLETKGASIRNGDVLLYKDGAHIGRKTFLDCGYPYPKCAVNEHVFILRSQNKEAQRYLFFWLDQAWMTQEIISLNSNSAQPGINKAGVRSLSFMVPSYDVIKAFNQKAADLTDRIFANCQESHAIAAQRDVLLPGLVSGEVRVGENNLEENES